MQMVEPRVLNDRAIKMIYIIHVEWPLFLPAWTTAVIDVLQHKILLNGERWENNSNFNLLDYFIYCSLDVELFSEIKIIFIELN